MFFDLTNEVLSGNSEKAVQLYEDLLLQGEETIKLNAILLNQIRLFLQQKFWLRWAINKRISLIH